jgi:hypothetical protein
MAFRQTTVRHRGLDPRGELQEPKRIRHGRSSLTDSRGEVFLAEPEFLDQLPVGIGRLERIEVLALEVLDQGELELVPVGQLPNHGRDPVEAGCLSSALASLAGHQLVSIDRLGDQDRLQDAVLDDARRQGREPIRIEPLARLAWVRGDPTDLQLDRGRLTGVALRDE